MLTSYYITSMTRLSYNFGEGGLIQYVLKQRGNKASYHLYTAPFYPADWILDANVKAVICIMFLLLSFSLVTSRVQVSSRYH